MVAAAAAADEEEEPQEELDCPICLMLLEESGVGPQRVRTLPNCLHAFHEVCMDRWLDKCRSKELQLTCPTCRGPIIR